MQSSRLVLFGCRKVAGEFAAVRKLFDEAIHRVPSVCFHFRDFTSTLGLHDRAIAILERIRDFDPQPKVISLLVRAYRDKAVVAAAMDDPANAEKWTAAAAGLRSGAGDSAGLEQADLLMDRARARYDADPQQAIALFRHALAIYERWPPPI